MLSLPIWLSNHIVQTNTPIRVSVFGTDAVAEHWNEAVRLVALADWQDANRLDKDTPAPPPVLAWDGTHLIGPAGYDGAELPRVLREHLRTEEGSA